MFQPTKGGQLKHYRIINCTTGYVFDELLCCRSVFCLRAYEPPAPPTRSSGMDGLHSKDVEAEKGMVRGYVQQYASEIAMLLSKVDRQLLLLFKTNDCLR